jgi:hypothetical protein
MTLLVFAIACEDAASSGDAAVPDDRGLINTDAEPQPDATADAGADAGTAPDAIPLGDAANIDGGPGDESIRGTPLQGIAIEWPERLELCNAWRESREVEEERADQAHVTMGQTTRPSLGSGHLSEARLPDVLARRGTLAAEHFALESAAIGSVLTRYDLVKNANYAQLNAEVQHNLGAAGVLYEGFQVTRQVGETRPVRVGGFDFEHYFQLWRPGAAEPVFLETCGGAPELDRWQQVISASNKMRSLTFVRQLRSRETAAGSFPIHLQSAALTFSDRPYQIDIASGWFAQTYAAAHHNWDDNSIVDFRRDPGFYQTIYGPYLAGMTPVPEAVVEIRLLGIEGPEMQIEIDTLDLVAHTIRIDTYDVHQRWSRVDHTQLQRTANNNCTSGGGDVFTLGYGDYVFQVLTCPAATPLGWEISGLVPVAFAHDMAEVGKMIDKESIESVTVDQRPGFRAAVGSSRVTITYGSNLYFMTVTDGNNTEVSSFASDPWEYEISRQQQTLRASDAGKTVSMRLDRLWAGFGVGESVIYAPTAFELTFDGQTVLVEAFDRLRYTNTHHNWLDQLEAKGAGLTITWSVRYLEGPQSCFVRVIRDSDGREVLPETELMFE